MLPIFSPPFGSEDRSRKITGRLFQAARVLSGLDQTELAERAGVSPATISNVETGRVTTSQAVKDGLIEALRNRSVYVTAGAGLATVTIQLNRDLPPAEPNFSRNLAIGSTQAPDKRAWAVRDREHYEVARWFTGEFSRAAF